MRKDKIAVPLLVILLLFQVMACSKEQSNESISISQSKGLGQLFNSADIKDKQNDAKSPVGIEEVLYKNGNIYGVKNGPIVPTVFTLTQPCKITSITNYHYFNHGVLPGTIALKDQDGTVYGPWSTEGLEGQGNVANASWIARPNVVVKAGTYTVIDSDPATWSQNDQSGGCGFTEIKGIKP
ncbi:MAG: hypothetical protein ABRQ26_03110 [Syntrophomonadaceae bacterium]